MQYSRNAQGHLTVKVTPIWLTSAMQGCKSNAIAEPHSNNFPSVRQYDTSHFPPRLLEMTKHSGHGMISRLGACLTKAQNVGTLHTLQTNHDAALYLPRSTEKNETPLQSQDNEVQERKQLLGNALELLLQNAAEKGAALALRHAHLESNIAQSSTPPFSESKGESEMANIYRQRIRIGYEENGKALFKDIRTHTAEEMQEKIVQTFVECGRIRDFLSDEWQYNPKTEEAESTAILFRDYAEEWLNTYKVKKVKPTTLNGYRSYLLHHFNPFFGDLPIDTITTTKIQEFLNERSHLARKTLQDQLKFFRSIMHSALEDGHIVNDPSVSKRLVIPSEKVTHREALPLAKTQDVVENLDKLCLEDRRMVALMIFTGMRRGEVLGTMWEDLNYQDAIINVQRNVTFSENQPTIGTPKSKSGTREVPLPNELIEQLQPLEQSGFIIGGEKPLSCQQFQNRWNRIKRTINLHGASPHIFRHSYLTYLAGSGVDVKTLQGIAGHADVQMTMNRYVHTQLENIQEAGKKLGNILSMNTDAVGKSDGNNKESKS